MNELALSPLNHTWLIDLDGTVLKHNGYKLYGEDRFLPGMRRFLRELPDGDMIIFLTSRSSEHSQSTERFLNLNKIRYDAIIYDVPFGERILINDQKPSGLNTAIAVNVQRDVGKPLSYHVNEML